MTRKKTVILCAAAVCGVIAAVWLWYARPMTLEERFPGAVLAECDVIHVSCEGPDRVDGRRVYGTPRELVLEPGDAGFQELLGLLEGRAFQRSLWRLVTGDSAEDSVEPGDFWWRIALSFSPLTEEGYFLHIDNFSGRLTVSRGRDSSPVRTAGQEQWLWDVLDVMETAFEN